MINVIMNLSFCMMIQKNFWTSKQVFDMSWKKTAMLTKICIHKLCLFTYLKWAIAIKKAKMKGVGIE